jgi:hypothetical protein
MAMAAGAVGVDGADGAAEVVEVAVAVVDAVTAMDGTTAVDVTGVGMSLLRRALTSMSSSFSPKDGLY